MCFQCFQGLRCLQQTIHHHRRLKDSANAGSVGIHQAFGFTQVGIVESCGWKLGAWRDIVIMQKTLGVGDTQPPLASTA